MVAGFSKPFEELRRVWLPFPISRNNNVKTRKKYHRTKECTSTFVCSVFNWPVSWDEYMMINIRINSEYTRNNFLLTLCSKNKVIVDGLSSYEKMVVDDFFYEKIPFDDFVIR